MGNYLNAEYFSIKRDRQIINAGGFFCQACLVGKASSNQSPDPCYCQGCYDFLLKEVTGNSSRRSANWKPRKLPKEAAQVSQGMRIIMSTLDGQKSEVDIIQPSVATKTLPKRGPKPRQLPEALIRHLANKGVGSKAIATRLKADTGITVSYKTIQRLLSGKRDSYERVTIDN